MKNFRKTLAHLWSDVQTCFVPMASLSQGSKDVCVLSIKSSFLTGRLIMTNDQANFRVNSESALVIVYKTLARSDHFILTQ